MPNTIDTNNIDEIYKQIQRTLRPGVTIIVGSGASCAHGLPGMGQLAEYLQSSLEEKSVHLATSDRVSWKKITDALDSGKDLETAMADTEISDDLYQEISSLISECIGDSERQAIDKILSNSEVPALGRLFKHVLSANTPHIDVITTNYDRLIEITAAKASLPLDTMYTGSTLGQFNPTASALSQTTTERIYGSRKGTATRTTAHVRLYKPHGSLDWYKINGVDYRSDLPLRVNRSIVAPGKNKYIEGYNTPFDMVRAKANSAIDDSESLLFVGYGFNDNHLQTHIEPKMRQVPSLIISRSLTPSALQYLSLNEDSIGIHMNENDSKCSLIQRSCGSLKIHSPIWNLDDMMKEVIKK